MMHRSISIYDYSRKKVCDLYDSYSAARGQAYNIAETEEIKEGWKELTFELPFSVDQKNNFRWNYIKNDYLIRYENGDTIDWFIVKAPKRTKNGKIVSATVKCPHISTVLKTKNLYLTFDDTNGIGTARYLAEQAQANTGWSIGTIDTFYENDGTTEKIRSLSSNGKRAAYQLITDICNLFNAYPVYHGDTKTVDILKMTNRLPVTELYIGKNLETLSADCNTDNIVTRLYVEGQYGDHGYVGIDDVNPTGLPFILNFDYFRQNGLLSAAQETAITDYLEDILSVKQRIRARMQSILQGENLLNEFWGQINYMVYTLSGGSIVKSIEGGTVLAAQKSIAKDDKLLVFKATGNYREVTAGNGGAVAFANDDVYAIKFITKPAGKIGAREVAIESKQKMIESTQRTQNNLFEITWEPSDAKGAAGSSASFSVTAIGQSLTYQWQTRASSAENWATAAYTGNQTNQITLTIADGMVGRQFRCRITDAKGNSLISRIATLRDSDYTITATTSKAPTQKQTYYNTLISDYTRMINNIYNGTQDTTGLYEAMRAAVEQAIDLDRQNGLLDALLAEQDQTEADFAAAMGDLLKDGYWSNNNYAAGQEAALYWDAYDHMEEASKPKVKYSVGLIPLSEAMGYYEKIPEINTKVRILDDDLKINDIAYISKRTIYLDDPTKGSVEISNEDIASSITRSFDTVLTRVTQLADIVDQRNIIYERARVINENGTIPTENLTGPIDIQEHAIESPNSLWHTDSTGAFVFESAAGDSAMRISGDGIQIASDRIASGEWDWESVLDGYGIDGSYITGGYVSGDLIEDGALDSTKFDENFMTRIYQDEQRILFEAKKTDELSATFEVTASQIRSEVVDAKNELRSSITQTASQIRAEVSDTRNGLQSSITQTASQIRAEVSDSVNGLNSRITQTASQIRSEVSDTKNNLQSSITQTASQIRSEVSDTANGLSSRITQNSNSIRLKVSKGDVATELSVECGNVSVTGGNLVVDGYVESNGLYTEIAALNNVYIKNLTNDNLSTEHLYIGANTSPPGVDVGTAIRSIQRNTNAPSGMIGIRYQYLNSNDWYAVNFNIADTQTYINGVSAARNSARIISANDNIVSGTLSLSAGSSMTLYPGYFVGNSATKISDYALTITAGQSTPRLYIWDYNNEEWVALADDFDYTIDAGSWQSMVVMVGANDEVIRGIIRANDNEGLQPVTPTIQNVYRKQNTNSIGIVYSDGSKLQRTASELPAGAWTNMGFS